jgi:hypothetical protein
MMVRRIAAGALFLALLAGGIRASMLRLLFPPHRPPDVAGPIDGVDRKPLRFRNDPTDAELVRFLDVVRTQTKRGDRIGLLMSGRHAGFSYMFWRANYELPGRLVLPPMDMVAPEDADVVALWDAGWGDPRYELVWAEGKGAILRRTR